MIKTFEHEEANPMAMYVVDPYLERRLKAERISSRSDRFDEVWDGVYFMPPLPNNEHQFFQTQLAVVLQLALGSVDQGTAYAGVNVSNREKGWQKNYRCPDVAVILPGCKAKNCGTHWFGGPDFAVEILSPKDRSREKLPFYSSVGVRERSEEHTSELQSPDHIVCRLLLEKKIWSREPPYDSSDLRPLAGGTHGRCYSRRLDHEVFSPPPRHARGGADAPFVNRHRRPGDLRRDRRLR